MTRDQAIEELAPIILTRAHQLIAGGHDNDAKTLVDAWLTITNDDEPGQ